MKILILVLMCCIAALASTTQRERKQPYVELIVQGRGSIVIELRPDQAPKLVKHFIGLVDSEFYNGMLFHRKVENFVLQAGDPGSKKWTPEKARKNPGESGGTEGLGDGGSGQTVPFEINDLVHDKYTIGMALESPMSDTGDSQFFINLKDNHRLNGLYVVFGRVVQGFDVVDKSERGDRIKAIKLTKSPF